MPIGRRPWNPKRLPAGLPERVRAAFRVIERAPADFANERRRWLTDRKIRLGVAQKGLPMGAAEKRMALAGALENGLKADQWATIRRECDFLTEGEKRAIDRFFSEAV